MAKNTNQMENPEVKDNAQVNPEAQAEDGAPAGEATQGNENIQAEAPAKGQETPKAGKKPKGKVYKFVSDNKFLTCASLGVQFMNGKAETESLEVAKALATLSGVTLVEE